MPVRYFVIASGLLGAFLLASFIFTHWQARRIAQQFPPKGQFVDVDGARVHYTLTQPAREAKGTIVLLHGASANEAEMRLALGGRLAAHGYRVICVDRPGHGWSVREPGESTAARQAQQVRQALEKIGVKHAIVAGHSLAGAMALQLALDHTDIVDGVVLLAPVTHPWPGGIAIYYNVTALPVIGHAFVNTLMMPAALFIFAASLTHVFAPQPPPDHYLERTGIELVLRPGTFRANALDVAGMYDFVVREHKRYGQISVPVSIITGDKDTIVLTHIHSYGSARDIPGASLHVMEGVGHSPHWARPDEVTDLIAAFAAKAYEAR